MAAIDRIYVIDYQDFDEFRLWCIVNKPSLLYNFYSDIFINYNEWEKRKKEIYDNEVKRYKMFFKNYPNRENYYDSEEWNNVKRDFAMFADEEAWMERKGLPIANFTLKQDRYLLWHCPIDFIRKYLEYNCGYKTKWYHKIFFKKI